MPDDLIVALGKKTLKATRTLEKSAFYAAHRARLWAYLHSDRRPWRAGYTEFKAQYLQRAVNDGAILEIFREARPLPPNYGFRLDARVVEIPWVLSRLSEDPCQMLDAGSSLNYEYVLTAPAISTKKLIILTLAPESRCFWEMGISYVFGDLRNTIFRDDGFDEIACISTIEHVGMDNSMYAGQSEVARRANSHQYLAAVKELNRILMPGGTLYLTFPFGRYEDHGWFQQLDSQMLDAAIDTFAPAQHTETIFRYDPDGWKLSDRAACADCQFFDVHVSKYFNARSTIEYPSDYPAGERAVACLELHKGGG